MADHGNKRRCLEIRVAVLETNLRWINLIVLGGIAALWGLAKILLTLILK